MHSGNPAVEAFAESSDLAGRRWVFGPATRDELLRHGADATYQRLRQALKVTRSSRPPMALAIAWMARSGSKPAIRPRHPPSTSMWEIARRCAHSGSWSNGLCTTVSVNARPSRASRIPSTALSKLNCSALADTRRVEGLLALNGGDPDRAMLALKESEELLLGLFTAEHWRVARAQRELNQAKRALGRT